MLGYGAALWQSMLDSWPYSERALWTCGLVVTLEMGFALWACFYEVCDRYGWCRSWRVHGNATARSRPPPALMREALIGRVVNGIFVRPILAWALFPLAVRCGMAMDAAALPLAGTALAQLLFFVVADDTMFYWTHRSLHASPWLYKHVHKQHHRFRFTHALASEFAHPLEDALNAGCTLLGPLLLGAHMGLFWLYGYIKLSQTVESHSGYVVPFPFSVWSMSSELAGENGRHEWHHSRNVGNYGGFFNWWDRAMGTDAAYEKWRAAGSPPLKELQAKGD